MSKHSRSKKKKTVEDLEEARENYLWVKNGVSELREGVEEIEKNVDGWLFETDRSLGVYRCVPDEAFETPQACFGSVAASGSFIAGQMVNHSRRFRQEFDEWAVKTPMGTAIVGNTSAYDMRVVAAGLGKAALQIYRGDKKIEEALEVLKLPSPVEERERVGEKLRSIEERLYEKYEGMWQTLLDETRKDRYRQASHSMREVMSEFLEILAPDEEVKKAKWWKVETKNGKPSQKQRVKYAIIGLQEESGLPDEDINLIENLMIDARNRYKSLNKIAHARDPEAEELFPLLESYIGSCQKIIEDILTLREKYKK